jgi:indole-3-glycerol phosphate synthase
MPTILTRILAHKREEVSAERLRLPADELALQIRERQPPLDVIAALTCPGETRIIAEIKQASPSRGTLIEDLDAPGLARTYTSAGAAMISVLTDQAFFQGSFERLEQVRSVSALPLLAKEFIVDPWQILRARAAGADSFLLIVAALGDRDLRLLMDVGRALGMEPLVEVHDAAETERALEAGAKCVGVNNRNLATFETSLATSETLAPLLRDAEVRVSESGIHTRADITSLEDCDFNAFLIGERLVTDPAPDKALAVLLGRST